MHMYPGKGCFPPCKYVVINNNFLIISVSQFLLFLVYIFRLENRI